MTDNFWTQYPKLTFDEKTHTYHWLGNSEYPSVTQPFDCLGYRKNDESRFMPLGCPDEAKKEEHSVFGKTFHKIANIIMLGNDVLIKDPDKRKDTEPWINQLKQFKNEYPLVPLHDNKGNPIAEYPMFSEKLRFFGTPDFFCRNQNTGELWLLDWKSTKYYQETFAWQTAGYELLIRELFGGNVFDNREKIIRPTVLFHPSLKKAMLDYGESSSKDKNAFLSILNTYKLAA